MASYDWIDSWLTFMSDKIIVGKLGIQQCMTCLETAHTDCHITRKATCALITEKTSQWSKVQALC